MALPSFIIRRLAAAASPASRLRSEAREKRLLAFGWFWADYRIGQTDKRSGKPVGTGMSSTGPWPVNPSSACRRGQINGNLTWQDLGPDTHINNWMYKAVVSDSHLPSTWIMPFRRIGHAVFSETGTAAVRARSALDRLMVNGDPIRPYTNREIGQTALLAGVGPDNPDLATAAPLGLAYASHAGLILSRAGAVRRARLETSGTRPPQVLTKADTRLTNDGDTGLQLVRTDGVVPTWIIAELGS